MSDKAANLGKLQVLACARPHAKGSGFTLVEVVVAVGIIAFALTAIIGLTGLAVQGTKDADLYGRLASINRRIAADFQGSAYLAVSGSFAAVGANTTSYYDYYGTPLTDCYGNPISANKGNKYFQCTVTNATPATGYPGTAKLLRVQIRWPYPQLTGTDTSIISVINWR